MKSFLPAALVAAASASAIAQTGAPASKPQNLSDHVKSDIARHRAMAQAHEAAARCLESGQGEENCQTALQASCRGLAIGKYCGLRHEH
jgi:hypothetical protein